jgi:hypothetical protein
MDIDNERRDNYDDERSECWRLRVGAPHGRRWNSGRPRSCPTLVRGTAVRMKCSDLSSSRLSGILTLDIHRPVSFRNSHR